jgi:hypothetical protein
VTDRLGYVMFILIRAAIALGVFWLIAISLHRKP